MTQAVLNVSIDVNRDRQFARDVAENDALNLVDNPQQLIVEAVAGADCRYNRENYEPDYAYYWSVLTATTANAGIDIGNESAEFEQGIWVTSGTPITVRMDFLGVQSYTGETIRFTATSIGGVATDTDTLVLTGAWQSVTLNLTPDTEHLYLRVIRIASMTNVYLYMRRLMVVSGNSAPTAFNSGAASDYYENVTTYVKDMSWNNGMDGYDQLIAPGSRLSLTLDNREGYFYPDDDTAPQIIETPNFDNWGSATEPQGWSVLSIVDANNITSQVGSDELHGGVGLEALNIYATLRTLVGIYQVLPTTNQRYKVTFTIGASSGLGGVRFFILTSALDILPISRIYALPGTYTFFFTAGTDTNFCITNNRYPCNITLESVEVYAVPRYAGLSKETLISVCGYNGSTQYQLFVGRIVNILPTGGRYDVKEVRVECVDLMPRLSELEYKPVLFEGGSFSVGTELGLMMPALETAWPYLKDFFVLDTSVLGVDTWLYGGDEGFTYDSATASANTLDFPAAAASNSEKGVTASSYIRDLMNAEMDGRFYIEARTGRITFIGRYADPSKVADDYSLTDDDYDLFVPAYADDIMNKVTIWFKQKRQGDSNSVLWSSVEDIDIPSGATKNITGKYRDPTNELVNVSAAAIKPLSKDVDYVVTPVTARRVEVAVDAGIQSATFNIINTGRRDGTLTTLQLRGTPIYVLTDQSVTVDNADSIYNHNIQERSYNIPLLSNIDDIIGIATGRVTMYGAAIERLVSITFIVNKTTNRYTRALASVMGLRVAIAQSVDKHTADYIVIGERWSVQAGGDNTTTVTWILRPCARTDFWILGLTGRSELGTTTVLAY